MTIYCTTCSQRLHPDELCHHRNPVCDNCCPDEHPGDTQ